MASHRFTIKSEDQGLRLDQAIAKNVEEVSRTLAKKLIAEGGVFLQKKRVKVAGRIVFEGQRVEVNVGRELSASLGESESVAIPIVELTASYVVVDKPSGVFSAPTRESDRNHLLAYLAEELEKRGEHTELYLVHRLDRPTSGLMVMARTKAAAATLSAQLSDKSATRHYLAIVAGRLAESAEVREPIEGKDAATDFVPRESRKGATLVFATLHTGRTHQVRLHAEHLGTPVAGDSKYGRRAQRDLHARPPRMALHATELQFSDPESGEKRMFSSPLPVELALWFKSLPDPAEGC